MVVQVTRPRSKKRTAPRLPRKVKTALADFQRRLLNLFPDDILAIILYGSYARGQAAPDSDVDVLVVVNRNAVSTAYYAMFYAARAALLTKKVFEKALCCAS